MFHFIKIMLNYLSFHHFPLFLQKSIRSQKGKNLGTHFKEGVESSLNSFWTSRGLEKSCFSARELSVQRSRLASLYNMSNTACLLFLVNLRAVRSYPVHGKGQFTLRGHATSTWGSSKKLHTFPLVFFSSSKQNVT